MKILLILAIVIIFIPKINLIDISATSGLRIDDVFILIFLLLISVDKTIFLSLIRTNKVYKWVLYITLLSIVSIAINAVLGNLHNPSINALYSIRLFEYSMFIVLGVYMYLYNINVEKVIITYTLLSICIIFLQYAGILGGFYLSKYSSVVTGRPMGLTAGAWEIAPVLVYGMILLSYVDKNKYYKFLAVLASVISIAITGSRIGMLSACMALFLINRIRILIYVLIATPFIIMAIFLLPKVSVIERSSALFSMNNLRAMTSIYDHINPDIDIEIQKEQYIDYTETDKDLSWIIRFSKWAYIIKHNLNSFIATVIGYSPGYYSYAVDGSYLRMFGELGIVGLISYYLLFNSMAINNKIRLMLYATYVNMIFIDVAYTYKTMSILFLLYGYYYAQKSYPKVNKINKE